MNSSSVNFPEFDSKNWLASYEPDGGSHRYFWTYLQWGALVDTTDPYASQEVFSKWWDAYGSLGVRAIWLDETEPDRAGYTYGDWRLAAGTDYEVGAGWKSTWIQTFSDGLAAKGIDPSERLIMSRSMWAGTMKNGNAVWSGDLQSTFSELQLQIAAAQGTGLSGQGLFTTDAGGYTGGDPADPQFQELIVRWFQFNAFMPLFRLHGHRAGGPPCDPVCGCTNGDNEIWTLAQDPAHYDAIVTVMLLREDLRNYVLALSQLHSATGLPMVRPLFLEFPLDPGCGAAAVEDQFMFGPDWLVAPVYTYQAASRSVYLPLLAGGDTWVYWWNQTSVGGGGVRVTVPTPLDEFPVFHRQQASLMDIGVLAAGPKRHTGGDTRG
jgi:alpha-D-xyloside xylohydrolase